MIILKFKTKNNSLTVQILLQSTKSNHFPLRGNVGQLRKRKRVLCLSIYVFSLQVEQLKIVKYVICGGFVSVRIRI